MDNRSVSRGDNARDNSKKELSEQHSPDRLMQLRGHHHFQDANVSSPVDTSASADASTRSQQRSDRHVQDSSSHVQSHQWQLDLSDPRASSSKGDAIASEATTSCHGSDGDHHSPVIRHYPSLDDLFDQWYTKCVLSKKRLDLSESSNIYNPLFVPDFPDFPDIMVNPLFELYPTNKQPEMDVSISPSGIGMDKNPHANDVLPASSGEAASLTIPKIKLAEGRKADRVSVTLSEKKYERANPEIVRKMNDKALLYKDQGKYNKAEQLYRDVLAIREQQLGPEHPDTAITLNKLAEVCYKLGKYEEAEQLSTCAFAIYEKDYDPDNSQLKEFRKNLLVDHDARKLNSAEPSGKKLPLMPLDDQGTSKAQSEIAYDAEQRINIKKQTHDTFKSNDGEQPDDSKQIETYLEQNPFTKKDFEHSFDIIRYSTLYDHDSKGEFLHPYFKHFMYTYSNIKATVEQFNILQSWQNDALQPHRDFAKMVLDKLYARCKPPWDHGN
jgi:tetratricopeptide (TPR) repeat protein